MHPLLHHCSGRDWGARPELRVGRLWEKNQQGCHLGLGHCQEVWDPVTRGWGVTGGPVRESPPGMWPLTAPSPHLQTLPRGFTFAINEDKASTVHV